ncbi:glycerate kinase, partial [Klebsiella pneumoniae]|uniref:glycerate kinase n=1 Tax=Klebsiella pneumoniae TaxID=573 RepID=UPI001230E965
AQRNPLLTTSWGTGELIRHALDAGVRQIIIGIGGSATNDGGAAGGMGAALYAFCGAQLRPGIEIVTDALQLAERVADADLV